MILEWNLLEPRAISPHGTSARLVKTAPPASEETSLPPGADASAGVIREPARKQEATIRDTLSVHILAKSSLQAESGKRASWKLRKAI